MDRVADQPDNVRIKPKSLHVLGRKSTYPEHMVGKKIGKRYIVDTKKIIPVAKKSSLGKRVAGRVAGATLGFILGNVPGAIAGYKVGGAVADITGPTDLKSKAKRLGETVKKGIDSITKPKTSRPSKRNFKTTPVSGRSAEQGSRGVAELVGKTLPKRK